MLRSSAQIAEGVNSEIAEAPGYMQAELRAAYDRWSWAVELAKPRYDSVIQSYVLVVGALGMLGLAVLSVTFRISLIPLTVYWSAVLVVWVMSIYIGRYVNGVVLVKRLRAIAAEFAKSDPCFVPGEFFSELLSKHDPRYAEAIGAPVPVFSDNGTEWNAPWRRVRRFKRWVRTADAAHIGLTILYVTWTTLDVLHIVSSDVAILPWIGLMVVGGAVFGVRFMLKTATDMLALKLNLELLRLGFAASLADLRTMVRAYRGRDSVLAQFWTRRVLSDLFANRDDLPPYERQQMVSGPLLSLWQKWWGKKLPQGITEVFESFA